MRARWVLVLLAVLLLMLAAAPAQSEEDGRKGVDPRLPPGYYTEGSMYPSVAFENETFEEGTQGILNIVLSFPGFNDLDDVSVLIELYGWAMFGVEKDYSTVPGRKPIFIKE
ncbi:MAG: hypothetical protein LN414_06465, partial [Candidatus Thermoplasmatota archaeon]|nr:hypothetical protein [Candidatus Thermoplasmatota archaeon]